ncbi:hypothetical protein QR680_011835 [Steinernema hermaphroditum]|uniref:C-type lectin domain-containing protein n=1 Tax=Steinernema hermaphroditum TaxID=289476 RepID=A0AA39LZE9_9BILA|nr:hypothetical protein QR680_011835 [Steinernema hermaphroditum]
MRAEASYRECVLEWYTEPVRGVIFNADSKMYHGFERIDSTRTARANETSFLLNWDSEDVCSWDAMVAVNKTIEQNGLAPKKRRCRSSWFAVTLGLQTYCYYAMPASEYNKTSTSIYDIVPSCKKHYPFSQAASIHSADENEALRSMRIWQADGLNYATVIIGMKLKGGQDNYNHSSYWEWADGSQMDFEDWNPEFCRRCPKEPAKKCGFVVLWTDHDRWLACDFNNRGPLLCKYAL